MLGIEEARKILGVSADASKNEMERRYWILLKRGKAEKEAAAKVLEQAPDLSEQAPDLSVPLDMDQVTKAYNILMGYEEPETEVVHDSINMAEKAGKPKIDKKKAGNFFYYYKVHIVVVVVLAIFLAVTIKSCVNKVEPDFNLAFLGKIDYANTDALKKAIKASVPEIKEPGFDSAYVTLDERSPTEETMMIQKAMVIMMAGDIDVYILDRDLFDIYSEDGYFEPLDSYLADAANGFSKEEALTAKTESDTAAHPYGIEITGSDVMSEAGISGKTMVAAIAVNSGKKELALEVIRMLDDKTEGVKSEVNGSNNTNTAEKSK
ncbi:MAG: hypothetical protein HGA22_01295 [Clostridiales bacterium]|nr:hypothetical protein [Clostridiales bacterium]